MPSLIESLISGAVVRQDTASLTVIKRPVPTRLRHVLEIFSAMGAVASVQALRRAIDFRGADPQTMTFAVLGRWPTTQELAAWQLPAGYDASHHLTALVQSAEFRAYLPRRACDAFPERRRFLFIRIPSSGGKRVLATLESKHPVLPLDLAAPRFDNPAKLAKTLGDVFARMSSSNAFAITQPSLAAFTTCPVAEPTADATLQSQVQTPVCRTDDLLFALIREPAERALAHVNAAAAALRPGERPRPSALRRHAEIPDGRAPDQFTAGEWRNIARALLARTLHKNPICHAIGDGTAAGMREACRRFPLHLIPTEQFGQWGRTALDAIPPDPTPQPEPVLREEDLNQAERAAIDDATSQDRIIHGLVQHRTKEGGVVGVLGRDL
jgi:hypothetical protein